MTKSRTTVMRISSGLVVLGWMASASAADTKAYNGSFCAPHLEGDFAKASYSYSGVRNNTALPNCPGGEILDVTCPIIRDVTNSSTGLDSVKVELNNHPTNGCLYPTLIQCTLYSMKEDSQTGDYLDYVFLQTNTTGRTELVFGNLATDLATQASHEGGYVLYCHLGSSDYLTQYTVRELNGTD